MPSENFERKLRERFAHAEVPPRPELWQAIEREISPPPHKGGLYLLLFEILFLAGLFFLGSANYAPFHAQTADIGLMSQQAESILAAPAQPSQTPSTQSWKSSASLIPDSRKAVSSTSQKPKNSEAEPVHISTSSSASSAEAIPASVPAKSLSEFMASSTDKTKRQSLIYTNKLHSKINATPKAEEPAGSQKIENQKEGLVEYNAEEMRSRSFLLRDDLQSPSTDPVIPIQHKQRKWHFHAFAGASGGLDRFAPFQLDENLSVDYAYVYPTNVRVGSYPQIEQLFSVRYPRRNLTVGAHLEYSINHRFSIQSGINFSWFEKGTYFIGEVNPYVGNAIFSGANDFNLDRASISQPLKFQYAQIELPVWLNTRFLNKNRSFLQLSLGGAINYGRGSSFLPNQQSLNSGFLRSSLESLSTADNSANNNSLTLNDPDLLLYKSFNFSLGAGLSYHYHLNELLRLYVGPEFQYQLTPIYGGGGSNGQPPYRLGLKLGFAFTTRK